MPLTEAVRAAAVPPFHAMQMSREASELEASGARVLHLEVGQPGTPAPAGARQAAVRAIEAGESLGYTNASGLMSLRRRIVQHYHEWYGVAVDLDAVGVVAGASAGFTLAFAAAFDAGDRVGIVEPGYPCYRNTLVALGIEPVPLPVGPETRWAPTTELLDGAGHLDGLIVASPSNPTGTVLDPTRLGSIVAWCEDNDVQLVADEIYHGITGDEPAPTAISFGVNGDGGGAIVVNSFSKYFSMTGWRLGWMVTPPHLRGAVERLQQNLYICAPHVSQVAGTAAFDCHDELQRHVARYAANRALLIDGLAAAGIDRIAEADGAFYVYADVSHLTDDSMALCRRWLADLHVACTPGLDFDLRRGHSFVRFSYAGLGPHLVEACERIAGWRP